MIQGEDQDMKRTICGVLSFKPIVIRPRTNTKPRPYVIHIVKTEKKSHNFI